MFCPRCGTSLPDGATFCSSCGARIAPERAGSPDVAPAVPASPRARRRVRPALIVALVALVAVVVGGGLGVWIAFFSPYPIDEKTFPDPALRAAVSTTYDADHDGSLSRDEARAVTDMSLSGCAQLSGLGRIFPNVVTLVVSGGSLTALDVSDLPALTTLDVRSEPLAALDVSRNASLSSLRVPDATQVTGLDATPLREVWVTADIAETSYGEEVSYHTERDDQGRISSWSYQYGSGPVVSGTYTYDEQGRAVALALNNAQSGTTGETYAYDDAGRLATIVATGGYSTQTTTYSYDDAGRMSQAATTYDYVSTPSTTSTTTYAYDDAGRLTQASTTGGSSATTWAYRTVYSYDGAGRLARQEFWNTGSSGQEELSYAALFSYDDAGHMVQTSYEGTYTDFLIPQSFVYDEQGRVVSGSTGQVSGAVQGVTYEASYTYDAAGRMVGAELVSTYGGDQNTDSYTASYTRRFIARDAPDPARGFSLIAYQGLAGADTIPLVGITNPMTGAVPSVALPPYNEDVYRGY